MIRKVYLQKCADECKNSVEVSMGRGVRRVVPDGNSVENAALGHYNHE